MTSLARQLGQSVHNQSVPAVGSIEHRILADGCVVDALVEALDDPGRDVMAAGHRVALPTLAKWSASIARVLRQRGVGPDVPVGLCLDRSVAMLAGMLGIWRAGGAWVPLDPYLPDQRLRTIVSDARPAVVVTARGLGPAVSRFAGEDMEVVHLDAAEVRAAAPLSREVAVEGRNLAYIMFTSGSTGCPKGVEIPHLAVANLLSWSVGNLDVGPADTVIAITTVTFDIAVPELLLPLLCRARLVVADAKQTADMRRLRGLIEETGGTVLQATPTTWRMLAESGGVPHGVRLRLSAGEALSRTLANQLSQPDAVVWNLYGPTETTVWSAATPVAPAPARVDLGRPLANTALYVIDENLVPVAPGMSGELYIGGLGVARGYRGRPDLTADRFVPDPFSDRAGARMYRTGDLVRRFVDGRMEYLGRVDHQVKVRGFRIETGEIEAVLERHAAVRTAVVVADRTSGETRLVGYVVPTTAGTKPADLWPVLGPYLRNTLPAYMVPAALVTLADLPRSPNAKLDRAALPCPQWGDADVLLGRVGDAESPAARYVAPRTRTEVALAEVWADLLKVERVGIDNSFLALGGDSLIAMRMQWQVEERFGVDLPLRTLLGASSLGELAATIDRSSGEAGPAIRPIPADVDAPLSSGQHRQWFLDRLAPGSPYYNIVLNLRLTGVLDTHALPAALTEIVRRHEPLRTRYVVVEGRPQQRVDPARPFRLGVVDLGDRSPVDRLDLAVRIAYEQAHQPFDLSRDALLRGQLIRLADDDHVLLLTTHHIAADGLSVGRLGVELAALYRAGSRGQASPLPPLPIRYADFAAWQCSWADSEPVQRHREYWRRQLADLPAAVDLPTDRPRPVMLTTTGAEERFVLSGNLAARLRTLGQHYGTTLYMTLLAGWQTLLAQASGQTDVAVGTPVAGRVRRELEQLVGLFVNTLVLRTDLSGDPTFGELLGRVREVTLAAYDAADVPFEHIVEDVQPARDLSRNPLVQVLFWLLPAHETAQRPDWGELEVRGFDPRGSDPSGLGRHGVHRFVAGATHTAHVDLELMIREGHDALTGSLVYSTELFDAATIRKLIGDFQQLMETLAGAPHTPLSAVGVPVADPAGNSPADVTDGARKTVAAQRTTAYVAPHTTTQHLLATIWSQLLGVEHIGVNDHFFELGGHSLTAMQVSWRLQDLMGVTLPVRAMFQATTLGELAELVDCHHDTPSGAIAPMPRQGHLPLSFAQQRLWFLDQLVPGDPAYTMGFVTRFDGALDRGALERVISALAKRHEVLRTRFVVRDGQPEQCIEPPAPVTVAWTDLRDRPDQRCADEAAGLLADEAAQPFDLANGPLFRTHLIRLADDTHVLIWMLHHIAGDGWSIGRLRTELGTLYRAEVTGIPADLPLLPVQYADFAAWQRAWLEGPAKRQALDYWTAKLADAGQLDLPTDRPRAALQNAGACFAFTLDDQVVSRLRELGTAHDATLFMTLLAGFQALLSRYSGQSDFTVGCPLADRPRAETARLVGLFLNVLVMRADLAGDPSFVELLRRVRDAAVAGYAHQNLPFEMLVDALAPERDLSRNPLFQVDFQLTPRAEVDTVTLPGVTMCEAPDPPITTAVLDLSMYLSERRGRISGIVRYKTDLFDESTIARMVGHFAELLAAVVREPERALSAVALTTPTQWRQVVVDWNATEAPFPSDRCLHELVERQVDRTPGAIAVTFGEERVSYRDLDRRANQLARHLRAAGVAPETLVGLYVERGVDMVVAVLGVLKAGGAYLPLDPEYPRDRVAYLLHDAGVEIVVTQERARQQLPAMTARLVCLDRDRSAIEARSDARLSSLAGPDNLAYVIYTSGSTGRPKGVLVAHRGVCNFAQELRWTPAGTSGRVALNAPLAFDQSLDTLLSLSHGWEIVVVPGDVRLAPREFLNWLEQSRVDVLECTPTQLEPLFSAGLDRCARLPGTLLVSGEPIGQRLWSQLRALNGVTAWNAYGPTECTIDSTVVRIQDAAAPTIGRPIHNVQTYLLDRAMQPVPVGVLGEIYIGGVGVARGYLGRPALTADRFVPDPFAPAPGARLYRTGDLASYQPDGTIRFLGRLDEQVKIRGYRIEPGEVEAVLAAHPRVIEVVVVAREDAPGAARLVAYLVVDESADAPSTSELRAYLLRSLPPYMVPSAFVTLPGLPLTTNGKLNRRALPVPTQRPDLTTPFEPARSPTERAIARIWQELLDVDRAGLHDSFFDLGGHSLVAMQALWQVQEHFGIALPVEVLFEAVTLADLAAAVDSRVGDVGAGDIGPGPDLA